MLPRLGTVRAVAKSQAIHGLGLLGFLMQAECSGTPHLSFTIPCVTWCLQAPPSSMLPSCTTAQPKSQDTLTIMLCRSEGARNQIANEQEVMDT